MNKPLCPGHSGKCKFCKSEQGYYRYVGISNFKEVTRNADGTTSAIVDLCCRACKENHTYAKKNFDKLASAKFGYRIPKGDEL